MAGEWIKVRTNLWDDPRVAQLCDLTATGEATVIGGLYWLWAIADEHSEAGFLPGLSVASIDRKTGVRGFGAALAAIGWISAEEGGITIIRFNEHNGASAKQRSQTAKRVASHKSNAKVTPPPLPNSDDVVSEALPREDKIREEVKSKAKSRAEAAPASRLPDDWEPTDADAEFCQTERPDLAVAATVHRFRDYWIAQPGAKGRKADWPATWRNWVRNERPPPRAAPGSVGQASPKFNPTAYVNRHRKPQ